MLLTPVRVAGAEAPVARVVFVDAHGQSRGGDDRHDGGGGEALHRCCSSSAATNARKGHFYTQSQVA